MTNSSATGLSGSGPAEGCSARARSRRYRARARSSRRSAQASSGSSCTASRKLPRTAAAVADGAEAVSTHVAHDDPYTVLGGDHLVQVAADVRAVVGGELGRGDVEAVDAWRQRSQQHARAAPATLRICLSSRSSARLTWRISPVPTAKKTALVTIRASRPSRWASGQVILYVMAIAPRRCAAPGSIPPQGPALGPAHRAVEAVRRTATVGPSGPVARAVYPGSPPGQARPAAAPRCRARRPARARPRIRPGRRPAGSPSLDTDHADWPPNRP